MNPHTTTRIGIVGLGNIGHFHADRLIEHEADLVGGMDIDPQARTRFAEKYGCTVYTRVDELFNDTDAVVIATPNRYHEKYTVAALEAGLDVLLEKPLAHSLESAERIVAAARTAKGFCMIGFKNRFAIPVKIIKQLQRNEYFGDIRHIEANYVRHRGVPGRGSWFTNETVAGGGSLIDIGVHAIDLSLYFLEFPPVHEVAATTRAEFGLYEDSSTDLNDEDVNSGHFGVDDSASAFVRCANDTTISLEVAWATNREADHGFTIGGTDAGARFDLNDHSLTLYKNGEEKAPPQTDIDTTNPQMHDRITSEQDLFLRTVARDIPPSQNIIKEGLAVQRVVNAIYCSSDEECAVQLESINHNEEPTRD